MENIESWEQLKSMLKSFENDEFHFTKARSIKDKEDYTKQYSDLEPNERDLLKGTFYKNLENLLSK